MKHANPTNTANRATAPYNFIELPDKVLEQEPDGSGRTKHDRFVRRPGIVHSGYFDCELTTHSPLYIRGMMESADYQRNGHKRFDQLSPQEQRKRAEFFKDAEDQPQIPASSLRGLIRNMFEIVTNGKMSRVSSRRYAYRSFEGKGRSLHTHYFDQIMKDESQGGDKRYRPRVRAGYMKRVGEDWFVQPARVIEGSTFCRVSFENLDRRYININHKLSKDNTKNNRTIFVRPAAADYYAVRNGVSIWMAWSQQTSTKPVGDDYLECQVVPSNRINGKTSEAVVYPPDFDKELLPLRYFKKNKYGEATEIKVAEDYQVQLTDGQIEKLGEQGVLQQDHPVFFVATLDVEGRVVVDAIGHTMMMRLLYKWSPLDLLHPQFRSDEKVDFTESIFGYVRGKKQAESDHLPAYASRISFTPGILETNQGDVTDLQPIVPYILGSPKPTTFQHYLAQDAPNEPNKHTHFDSKDATLRGHKLYWHKGALASEQIGMPFNETTKITTQNTVVKMVRPKVRFRFRVHFENLSNMELGALQYVLSLPASTGSYRYKLGMAKPLGAGAISIDAELHLIDRDLRYSNLLVNNAVDDCRWEAGEVDAAICRERSLKAKERFETQILKTSQGATSMNSTPRIRQLLTMLNFDKVNVEHRYMELPQFRERRVLPRPEGVK